MTDTKVKMVSELRTEGFPKATTRSPVKAIEYNIDHFLYVLDKAYVVRHR